MEGWVTKPLGEVCELYQPQTISKKDLVEDGEYPVFGANGQIGFYDKFNHEDPELLITCRGATCGTVNVSLPRSWVTGNSMVVKPKSDCIHREFLAYGFRGVFNLSGVISGSAQPQITRTSLSPVLISFPPLSEQRRIVAILDEAFAAIETATAAAEKNLANARELFESELASLFLSVADKHGVVFLGDVCGLQNGFAFKSTTFGERGIPVLRISNIQNGRVDEDRMPLVDPADYKEDLSKYHVEYGDLLIAMSGATTGKVGVNEVETTLLLNQRVGKFEPTDLLNKTYLYFFLRTIVEQNLAISAGSAQPNLSTKQIKEIEIPLPPIADQEALVDRIEQLNAHTESLRSCHSRKLALLGELKQSLLQKAFRGEL